MSEPTPKTEYILTPSLRRFILFPIKHPELWKLYKQQEASFWTVGETDLAKDRFDELPENEKTFIKHVLAFFANADGIVNENLCTRFASEVQVAEARSFYAIQQAIEAIHAEMYSTLIDTYVKDNEEKDKLFRAIETMPIIAKKGNWAMKWINSQNSFALRLIAFAIIEGVFFAGSFCSIYWLKQQRRTLPGLFQSNHLIQKDESLHCLFATVLFSMLENKPTYEEVLALFEEAVALEREFVEEAIPVQMIGMNSKLMVQYIEYMADRLLTMLGYPKRWGSNNPFDFMETISLTSKANFFENRVVEYQKSSSSEASTKLDLNVDF